MYPSVKSYFIAFNQAIEDRIDYMYLDIKGLVTIGIGNLIDVENAADKKSLEKVMKELVTLPFVYRKNQRDAGKPATKADIEAEWKRVKDKQEWAKRGAPFFSDITKLELQHIDHLVLKTANTMERELKTDPTFQGFDQWPADAQLGLLSMSWAVGTTKLKANWPNVKTACQKQDFDKVLKHCEIRTSDNPGVVKRNIANRRLFNNAAAVLANAGKNPAQNISGRMTLYYPGMMLKKLTVRG